MYMLRLLCNKGLKGRDMSGSIVRLGLDLQLYVVDLCPADKEASKPLSTCELCRFRKGTYSNS
eukprot:7120538-Ditylum_brightwellii.AAC.1